MTIPPALPPELSGYEPHDDRPSRFQRRQRILRVVVALGIIGLVLPGILITVNTAERTAQQACAMYTAYLAPASVSYDVSFDLLSPAGLGWNCTAIAFNGERTSIQNLGLIPGLPALPADRPAPA